MVKTKLTVADVLSSLFLLIVAGLLFCLPLLQTEQGAYVLITTAQTSEPIVFDLKEDREVQLLSAGHHLTVRVENKSVRVLFSDCRDQICVGSGSISKAGEVIVCAPAKVAIRIEGRVDDVDFVVG